MADDSNTTSTSSPRHARRSSFAGETFANLFGTHRGSVSRSPSDSQPAAANNNSPQQPYPGPITSAAAQAQRRRLSLTTLGLSGSPNQTSPFGSYHNRRDSYVSGNSDAIDESAIEDEPGASQTTPFGRRMSFGAKALRDVRTGGTSPGQNGTSKPSTVVADSSNGTVKSKAPNGTISSRDAKGRGNPEGFNWSENFRTRAERTASIAGGTQPSFGLAPNQRDRAKSVAVMEPPAREMPKPKEQVRPDHFQERILKGDFYMD
ncbi:uncharacterized protein RCC_04037 [Ramularia collo-cygni]|uniref:Uncharacterized protein n=1 Tax=Ramularia collo-cygni TaxID=112498 RepID=A0A2D3V0L0_9PEZI|nr:uncharacterized protein RCC_04037 [Ramularia collo-cygni]CZT18197.1 uncharacterized protein RCC_04037 [Ramularia collo-cygni]